MRERQLATVAAQDCSARVRAWWPGGQGRRRLGVVVPGRERLQRAPELLGGGLHDERAQRVDVLRVEVEQLLHLVAEHAARDRLLESANGLQVVL